MHANSKKKLSPTSARYGLMLLAAINRLRWLHSDFQQLDWQLQQRSHTSWLLSYTNLLT
jgi:hypothetical protein